MGQESVRIQGMICMGQFRSAAMYEAFHEIKDLLFVAMNLLAHILIIERFQVPNKIIEHPGREYVVLGIGVHLLKQSIS